MSESGLIDTIVHQHGMNLIQVEHDHLIHIPLLSISCPVWEALALLPIESKVIGVFQHAVDMLVGEEVIALVSPPNKNGVFHAVVSWLPKFSSLGYDLHEPFTIMRDDNGVRVGKWLLEISAMLPIWEPKPNWDVLREKIRSIDSDAVLSFLKDWLSKQIQSSPSRYSKVIFGETVEELLWLKEGLHQKEEHLINRAIAAIVGRGAGLTPAGDDFLAGIMLGSYLFGKSAEQSRRFCESILKICDNKTTTLSMAFLKAAAKGYADERWQGFLEAVGQPNRMKLEEKCLEVISYGASSGWDMLNGFLWMWEDTHCSINLGCDTF